MIFLKEMKALKGRVVEFVNDLQVMGERCEADALELIYIAPLYQSLDHAVTMLKHYERMAAMNPEAIDQEAGIIFERETIRDTVMASYMEKEIKRRVSVEIKRLQKMCIEHIGLDLVVLLGYKSAEDLTDHIPRKGKRVHRKGMGRRLHRRRSSKQGELKRAAD